MWAAAFNDDGCKNDGDEHDLNVDIQDEWDTNVEDLETSDEEWVATKAKKVGECKKQKDSGRIDNAKQVGKQDMAADNWNDTNGETDEDVPRLLRKKEKPVKVDERTDFEKFTWQVRMTFGTVQGFKDAISRFAIAPEYDITMGISDHSLMMAIHLHRKGNGADQGNNLSFSVSQESKEQQLLEVEEELEAGEDISFSSGPQSMIDQGQPLIFSQPPIATSSSQAFISPP
ncbi:hypothetical protein Cgig2_032825 [Carnegiea gigantea]|uniref:Uncharacterized protein n=1 Tax=Carnegiea gigantea TaxID=171969 RepID=A0A9Q1Q5D4_9CARY|nr:hypothetical protein Cgig2_032825 [Carnegiea gigantea]